MEGSVFRAGALSTGSNGMSVCVCICACFHSRCLCPIRQGVAKHCVRFNVLPLNPFYFSFPSPPLFFPLPHCRHCLLLLPPCSPPPQSLASRVVRPELFSSPRANEATPVSYCLSFSVSLDQSSSNTFFLLRTQSGRLTPHHHPLPPPPHRPYPPWLVFLLP